MADLEAKLSQPKRFFFLPATQDLGLDGLLTLSIYTNAGQLLTGSPFSAQVVASPAGLSGVGIYQTEEITFPLAGAYYTLWECDDPAIKVPGQIVVFEEPVGNVSAGLSRKYRYTTPSFDSTDDLILRVYTQAGVQVGGTHTTAVTPIPGVYETSDSFMLNEAGYYLFVWTSEDGGYTWTQIQDVQVLASTTRTARVFVIDVSVDPQVPQSGADVLISEADGTPLFQLQLNEDGYADFALLDGNYVATVRKTGVTYGKNNLAFTVAQVSSTNDNEFYLFATPFSATFDPTPLFTSADKSKLLVDLSDMHGRPIVGATLLISNRYTPGKRTGLSGGPVGLLGGPVEITTDGNGHAETMLLRGALVTVAFEGTSVRRTITVPDQASFDLLDLITGEDDPFDVIIPNIATAERRS